MENKWKPLDKIEREKASKLNDPLIDLIRLNGWRRSELAQVLMAYNNGDYAYFRPKKQKDIKSYLITKKEKELIRELQNGLFSKTKPTMGAFNRAINRHYERISSHYWGNKSIFPHRIRATFGTELARMSVPESVIQKSMNHKNRKTTHGYIQPEDEDVFEAKQTKAELITMDGMTIHEWRKFALEKVKQIKRLEERIKNEPRN